LAILSAGFLVATISSSSAATSIGASFIGRGADPGDILSTTESAGVVPQIHWNNIDSGTTFKGTSQSLTDSGFNFTDVKIIYDASDSWNSDGGSTTPDEKLMKGIIKANPDPDLTPANNSDRMRFVITNVPSGTYNVIVYCADNGAIPPFTNAEAAVSIGATTYYVEQEASFTAAGSFIKATSTTPGTYTDGNYVEFDGISPSGGTITITATKNIVNPQQTDGIGVAGIQLIQVSGGAYPPNTSPCAITANPSSTLAVEGGTATFNVASTGPAKYLWTKNGSVIPGKTDATLVYTTVLADDGALIRAVVYNNVNTNTSTAAILSVDANTPPALTQGFLKVERWENIGDATGSGGVNDLRTNIPGSGNVGGPPTTTFYVGGGNIPQSNPDISNFGDRAWGWVKPDVTGDYDFFIRADDATELYLNSTPAGGSGTNTLPDVQVDGFICRQYVCCQPFQEQFGTNVATTFTPIHLEAGKLYGMVLLLKEAGGGDFAQVAWRLSGNTTPAASLLPIPAANTYTLATPAGQRASITTQPVPATVLQGRQVSFNVAVTTTPVAGTYSLQWYKNGTAISGATATSYTIPPAAWPGDNGAIFTVQALTLRGVLVSSNATLTVNQDLVPPVASLGSIIRNDGVIEVGVSFDEPINNATLIPANFTVIGAGSTTLKLATNSYGDYSGVVLDTTGLTAGNTYTGRVHGVSDIFGNVMAQTDIPFTVGAIKWAESGTPTRPGQVVPAGPNGFDILNGGRGEWGTYDEVTMAYVKKTNDFDVQVQVVYAEPSSQWSRVGLQARNGLDVGESPDDRNNSSNATVHAYAQTHVNPNQTIGSSARFDPTGVTPANQTPNNGHEQNQRLAAGAATTGWGSTADAPVYPNVWLRLQRVGTNINGFRSTDGKNWIGQGSTSLTNQQPDMYVGISESVETANIWAAADYDVWNAPFDARYDRLFVAQFRNFTDVPSLSIALVSGVPRVTFAGILQSSTTVSGTYTNVPGATSPYTVPLGPTARFYRTGGVLTEK